MTRRLSRLPRWVHRLYAGVAGYFWVPCPTCGENFGGHEVGDRGPNLGSIQVESGPGWSRGVSICPACTREGRGRVPRGVIRIPDSWEETP